MKKKISFQSLGKIYPGFPDDGEVLKQRSIYGLNEIFEKAPHQCLELLKDTSKDPMIWFLTALGIIFFIIDEHREALTLIAALLPLVLMDAFLHRRTQVSMRRLKRQLKSTAVVLRNFHEKEVNTLEIVPGDLVKLKSNEVLPADGVFEETKDLLLDESSLTGEASPISKVNISDRPFDIYKKGEDLVPVDSLGFAGTRVLRGSGFLRVLKTGKSTAYGEIIQSVLNSSDTKTVLQKSIQHLVMILSLIAGLCCLFLATIRIFQGKGWLDALLSSAVVAMSAIPEEFPVVFTFYLGLGVFRLAKKKALVRKAVSVENIGRVSVICTDKTGTITTGKLKLTHLKTFAGFSSDELLEAAVTASDSLASDPVDQAIFELSNTKKIYSQHRVKVFPFTEMKKNESVISQKIDGTYHFLIKGSPETIIQKTNLDSYQKEFWLNETKTFASEGHKVLACAQYLFETKDLSLQEEPLGGYEFLGLLAFEDPLRPEARDAIIYCNQNKIKVLMLTGDHPETARTIANEVGIGNGKPFVISAQSTEEIFSHQWIENNLDVLSKLDVVARCTPIQKLNIVNAFKNSGEIVAVTGDGVNDVPALKNADVGISMGIRGTRSAIEVSSIVLADDNFSTIVCAIKEGKQLFHNLRLSFKYLLLIHIPFVLSAALIPALGYPLLYHPVHVVWVELIIHPTALLAFQLENSSIPKEIGDRRTYLFTPNMIFRIVFVGIIFSIFIFWTFISSSKQMDGIFFGRSKVMAMLSIFSASLVVNLSQWRNYGSIFVSVLTVLFSFLMIEIPFFSSELSLTPIGTSYWLGILVFYLVFLFVLFVFKV